MKKATLRWLFSFDSYLMPGYLVGAIGLEPTTPTMSK